jgi:hypothetical protein
LQGDSGKPQVSLTTSLFLGFDLTRLICLLFRWQVKVTALSLVSPDLANPIKVDASKSEELKKNPVTIKEGAEYSVELTFKVDNAVVAGLRYLQVVKRAGVRGLCASASSNVSEKLIVVVLVVDKLECMPFAGMRTKPSH